MNESNVKYIVIPDVHGRTFWKDALRDFNRGRFPNAKVIFLGDYLDPYTRYEGITHETAYHVFKDIMKWVRKHKDKAIMLLGNHDMHYLVYTDLVRLDFDNVKKIQRFFQKYSKEYFNIAYEDTINGKKYLFTHAGVLSGWLHYNEKAGAEATAEYLNSLLHKDGTLTQENPLFQRSRQRGGYFEYGSPIWADIREHLNEKEPLNGVVQIFGHSWCESQVSIDNQFVMLDCRKAFLIDSNGQIDQYRKEVKI